MFSVYSRGMNFKDMMTLKWSDIHNNRIYYVRSKTKGKLNFEIIPPLQEILNYYKAQNRNTDFVFPILLKEDLTPLQISAKTLICFSPEVAESSIFWISSRAFRRKAS